MRHGIPEIVIVRDALEYASERCKEISRRVRISDSSWGSIKEPSEDSRFRFQAMMCNTTHTRLEEKVFVHKVGVQNRTSLPSGKVWASAYIKERISKLIESMQWVDFLVSDPGAVGMCLVLEMIHPKPLLICMPFIAKNDSEIVVRTIASRIFPFPFSYLHPIVFS